MVFKWSQHWNFSKLLTHDSGQKVDNVRMFFLDKTVKRNVFGNDSYDKPAISDYKKVDF